MPFYKSTTWNSIKIGKDFEPLKLLRSLKIFAASCLAAYRLLKIQNAQGDEKYVKTVLQNAEVMKNWL